jgi:hypothetical protein
MQQAAQMVASWWPVLPVCVHETRGFYAWDSWILRMRLVGSTHETRGFSA